MASRSSEDGSGVVVSSDGELQKAKAGGINPPLQLRSLVPRGVVATQASREHGKACPYNSKCRSFASAQDDTKCVSRAFGPGGEVLLLFGGEFVDFGAEGFEFEVRDLRIKLLGHRVDALFEFGGMLD